MTPHRYRMSGQRGYVLLSVMLLITLLLLTLSIELPRIAQQIKREKEEELIHRGNEYKNAVRKFYRKNGRYPLTLEDLEKANNLRFLRKRYKDPFTGKDDWRLLHVGEVQLNVGGGANSAPPPPTFGGGPTPQPIGPGNPGNNDPNAVKPGGAVATETGSGSQAGTGSPIIGGGPIIGVASIKKLASIKQLDKKDHYNDWLFFYDPRLEQQQVPASGLGAVPGPVTGPGVGTGPGPAPAPVPGPVPRTQ
ncbi:MAG TPA: hypothetical protein VNW97_18005 [Candidatus Saccharimonadales bacterium]|jgi:type II secretory pathway pseudopilin PulG|nr:hypothetical protein [Candidatus Saccharimonadales bacterium]